MLKNDCGSAASCSLAAKFELKLPSKRLVCFTNGVFGPGMGGGDVHLYSMCRMVLKAGGRVHFFGGHALRRHLEQQCPGYEFTLTDGPEDKALSDRDLSSQFRLFAGYLGRCWRTLRQLNQVTPDDMAYATSDYWFDALPLLLCRARHKVLISHMESPTLAQIARRSRLDVAPARVNSLHYWLSQRLALAMLRLCRCKRLLYVNPTMEPMLKRAGFKPHEMTWVSEGVDVSIANQVPPQPKRYDVVWVGRVHQQKGINDLIATLKFLKERFDNFRAVLVGNLKADLAPALAAHGLTDCTELAGLAFGAEKFKLLKSSRLFLMPSNYESWGIVIGEALASDLPVVAYDLPPYRPIFGSLLHYAPPFDLHAFQEAAAEELQAARAGRSTADSALLERFKQEQSWEATGRRFLNALSELSQHASPA